MPPTYHKIYLLFYVKAMILYDSTEIMNKLKKGSLLKITNEKCQFRKKFFSSKLIEKFGYKPPSKFEVFGPGEYYSLALVISFAPNRYGKLMRIFTLA